MANPRTSARCGRDVGLSEQDPGDELQIELNHGFGELFGGFCRDAAAALRVAFAGAGGWRLGRSDRRNA